MGIHSMINCTFYDLSMVHSVYLGIITDKSEDTYTWVFFIYFEIIVRVTDVQLRMILLYIFLIFN